MGWLVAMVVNFTCLVCVGFTGSVRWLLGLGHVVCVVYALLAGASNGMQFSGIAVICCLVACSLELTTQNIVECLCVPCLAVHGL